VAAVLGITAALGFAQHASATPAPSSPAGGSAGSAPESTVRPPTVEPARPAPFFPSSPPDVTTHGSR
jgi:hypothetical protein